jgi:hypothetical protein
MSHGRMTASWMPIKSVPALRRAPKADTCKGRRFASTLVGLDREAAVRRATERGFEAHVVPHTDQAVTDDLKHNRLRLFLDEKGTVVRAHAG